MSDELLSNILLGLSLSAACGLRAFVPAALVSAAVLTGHAVPSSGFLWLGSPVTLTILCLAGAAEIAASLTTAGARFLDLVSTPLAMIVGSLLVMAVSHAPNVVMAILLPVVVGLVVSGLSQSVVSLLRSRAIESSGGRGRMTSTGVETVGAAILAAAGLLAPPAGGILAIVFLASRWREMRAAINR
jgi:hypothetical protein